MNKETDYNLLLEKYLANNCSPEEIKLLFDHLHKDVSGKILLKGMQKEFAKRNDSIKLPEEVSNRILSRLKSSIKPARIIPLYRRKSWYLVASAAVIGIVITAVMFFYNQPVTHQNSIVNYDQNVGDIPAGSNKAILILEDGTEIVLDELENGIIKSSGNAVIEKQSDGQLLYRFNETGSETLVYNTIITPRGGQYQVVLPDGTNVWLNSASSLRFPTAFPGKQRNVELTGEAYFEVISNPDLPFHVSSGQVSIEVTGTRFNIMSYKDEASVKTTLLEGIVHVNTGVDKIRLAPGQQSEFMRTGKNLKVFNIDTEEAIAWKNGLFIFSDENIESIMRKISRWYNVDIEYEGDVKNRSLWGTVSRFENVSEVLRILELTGVVHFKLEGKKITVKP